MKRPTLRPGATKPASEITYLRERLKACGHLIKGTSSTIYDSALVSDVLYFQQTHIDPTGKPLEDDGIVGANTWWALENFSGEAQKSGISARVPSGLQPRRHKLLTHALTYHGVKEVPDGSNSGPEVTRFLANCGIRIPAPWCAAFFSTVYNEALGSYPFNRALALVWGIWNAAKAAGTARLKAGYSPIPGDAFMMLNPDGTGHIGFVLAVSGDGSEFNTVEGNAGNRVKVGLRSLNTASLKGFVVTVPDETGRDYARQIFEVPSTKKDTTR